MRIYDSVSINPQMHAHPVAGVNFIPIAHEGGLGYRIEPHDGGPPGYIVIEPDFVDDHPRIHITLRYQDTVVEDSWP